MDEGEEAEFSMDEGGEAESLMDESEEAVLGCQEM